ncbi:hypothetical protein ACJ72_07494 [Emergomyces africanus]|uniref:Uncharacterized protein n=1 Tax=Emergomyces africanus TaxID=1955775 RepID=A0A1B7NN10_9EURO|nr:hypothetical protein ACJ72_07494 [Emergomyces africanus]
MSERLKKRFQRGLKGYEDLPDTIKDTAACMRIHVFGVFGEDGPAFGADVFVLGYREPWSPPQGSRPTRSVSIDATGGERIAQDNLGRNLGANTVLARGWDSGDSLGTELISADWAPHTMSCGRKIWSPISDSVNLIQSPLDSS